MWLSKKSRPGISFDVGNVAPRLYTATVQDILNCNKIIFKITSNSFEFEYQELERNLIIALCTYGKLENEIQLSFSTITCRENSFFHLSR